MIIQINSNFELLFLIYSKLEVDGWINLYAHLISFLD